jgi:hypothetical protein
MPSEAFKNTDPIAYRCERAAYIDSLLGDLIIEANGCYYLISEVDELLDSAQKIDSE